MRCSTAILAGGRCAPPCTPKPLAHSGVEPACAKRNVRRFIALREGPPCPSLRTRPGHRDCRWSATRDVCRPGPAPCFRAWRQPRAFVPSGHLTRRARTAFEPRPHLPSAASGPSEDSSHKTGRDVSPGNFGGDDRLPWQANATPDRAVDTPRGIPTAHDPARRSDGNRR